MAKQLAEQCTLIYPVDKQKKKVWFARHKRDPFKGKRSGYGGGIDDEIDRSPRGSACREFFEESGVTIALDDLQYLGMVYFHRNGRCVSCFIYTVSRWKGEFQETEEMEKAEAFPQNALPFNEMTEGDEEWLPQALAGELRECDFHVYHNENWTLDRVESSKAA